MLLKLQGSDVGFRENFGGAKENVEAFVVEGPSMKDQQALSP